MTLGVFERGTGHEQVVFGYDRATGLKAIVGLYSTALGPGLGGTRFYPYASEDEALDDVLRLSHGMAYKNALAGLPLGGGKAVIIGDPAVAKTPALLEAYGRFVDSLAGRYITAVDVGTDAADMDIVATQTKYVVGRSAAAGGIGDPSPYTAFGVYQGMRAAAAHRWGSESLAGKRVGVAGVGKVGHLLLGHLLEEGAEVVITDVRQEAVDAVRRLYPNIAVAADTDELIRTELDVFAPCAMGGVLHDGNVDALAAEIVCGAANNQLAHPGLADALHRRGVLYAPDYLVNAGGVIHVADELHGYDADRVRQRTARIFDTMREVLTLAEKENVTPLAAANRLAEERMAAGAPAAASR
ncbi:Glu/Leu/Phe/Val dehydrogenase dimerization domain-containing protein [Thermocrispum sp.]|uniref:Glu/Leu/Phe/Val family dehydrogenase n=1 Tax=Thermocrispum sp. TaxID=2060768 RepID=UPI002579866A|nr:Glu/Leu/Phe/Val dehydrogenase dimerization domain-containing protein [Thermocrispum sp.]